MSWFLKTATLLSISWSLSSRTINFLSLLSADCQADNIASRWKDYFFLFIFFLVSVSELAKIWIPVCTNSKSDASAKASLLTQPMFLLTGKEGAPVSFAALLCLNLRVSQCNGLHCWNSHHTVKQWNNERLSTKKRKSYFFDCSGLNLPIEPDCKECPGFWITRWLDNRWWRQA